MSKASEWTAKYVAPYSADKVSLSLATLGTPLLAIRLYDTNIQTGSVFFEVEEALAMAHWILDTFGETP